MDFSSAPQSGVAYISGCGASPFSPTLTQLRPPLR